MVPLEMTKQQKLEKQLGMTIPDLKALLNELT